MSGSVSGNFLGEQTKALMGMTNVELYWKYESPSTGNQAIEAKVPWNDKPVGAAPQYMVEWLKDFISKNSKDTKETINILGYDWHFIMPGPALSNFADKIDTYNESMEQ